LSTGSFTGTGIRGVAFIRSNLIADCRLRIAESRLFGPIRNPQSEIRNMIDPKTRIGHVHLTVSDLDRALRFYRDVLGFEVTTTYGRDAVFLAAGGYHHHIGLNTWAGRGAPQPAPGTTGLYHFAILYPDRRARAAARTSRRAGSSPADSQARRPTPP